MVHKSQKPLVQVNLRLRDDLRRKLAGEAKKSGRSFNQEIVERLERSSPWKLTRRARSAAALTQPANESSDQNRYL